MAPASLPLPALAMFLVSYLCLAPQQVQAGRMLILGGTSNSTTCPEFSFTTVTSFESPQHTQLDSITDAGTILLTTGNFDNNFPSKGATVQPPYSSPGDFSSPFVFPGATQTSPSAINKQGHIVGYYEDGTGNTLGFSLVDGKFASFKHPNDTGSPGYTAFYGNNDNDLAVGAYNGSDGNVHGFSYDLITGDIADVSPTGVVSSSLNCVTNSGTVVGTASKADGTGVGFLFKEGSFSEFSFPGTNQTFSSCINDAENVVGGYTEQNGDLRGFLAKGLSGSSPVFCDLNPPGIATKQSVAWNGINSDNTVVGYFFNSTDQTSVGLIAKVL